jgi:quercetin dioxygenase-like cupin family protein
MKIVSIGSLKKFKVKMPGAFKAMKQSAIGVADGSKGFAFRVFTLKPGGHTPFHAHDFEHLNYVVSGIGALVTEAGPSPVARGDFAFVPGCEKHQYRNRSRTRDFVFICAVPSPYE